MKRKAARYVTLAVASLGICVGVFIFKQHLRAVEAERVAAKSLEAIGAILVRDGFQHVASINLSSLQSRAELEAALNAIADLRWLTSFDASRTPLNDDDLRHIAKLSELTSLALAETDISDASVGDLQGLGRLVSLNLARTQLTSAALDELAELKALKILDLTGTKVSCNLEALRRLPKLEWIALRNLKLADDALSGLAECTTLHRVSLEESTFSARSLKSLQDQSPTLVIDR